MGQSTSSGRRRHHYYPPPPPPPPAAGAPIHHYSPYPPPPPSSSSQPLPPQSYAYYHQPPVGPTAPAPSYYYGGPIRATGSLWASSPHTPWLPSSAAAAAARPPPPPPEFVEHQEAKTIRNDVNLQKDTIRLVPDERDPDCRLVSFTFDATVDGSVIVYYFAKEGKDCSISTVYPDFCTPKRVPFQKGVAQKFIQPPGSGVDLGFFSLDELSKPSGEIFPLVICAEASPPSPVGTDLPTRSIRTQITLAVIEKNNNDEFQVKVVKQILWVDGERYELQEIFGIVNSPEAEVPDANDEDIGKECVICLSEPRDTAVLPCRHLCMCRECAKALRLQSNKCPICRQPVEKLMEIKVKSPEP